jgi:tetratricopeptide (TPR) repeat protein
MSSQTTIFPPLALSLMLLLGSGGTASAVATASQATPSRSVTPNQVELLADLAVKLATSGNIEQALPLFERAVQVAEAIPNQDSKIKALSAIALKLAEVGQTQRSEQLFDRAVQLTKQTSAEFDLYSQGPALRDVIIQIAQAGQTERALQLSKTLASNFLKAQALNEIAVSLANKGQQQQAKQVLLEALQFAKGITGDYAYESNGSCGNEKFEVLSKIAGNLSLLSQLETALQVAGSVSGCSSAAGESHQDYQAWAYLGILSHLAKVDQVKQTWKSAQTIESPLEQAIAWSAIALKLVDMGETPLALSVARKVTEIRPPKEYTSEWTQQNFQTKEGALRDIAIKLAQKQQFETAMQVVQGMTQSPQQASGSTQGIDDLFPRPSIKDVTLREIAHQLALAGQVSQAVQMANGIPDTEAKALAVIAIARVLQKTGQETQASQLLQDLSLPPTPTKPNDYQGYQPRSRIAAALVTVGQTNRAIQMAQSIQDDSVKESTLTDIATQLANIGQVEPALKLANTLTFEGSRATVFNKVAAKLVELGQLDQAFQIASSLQGSPSSLQGTERDKLLADIANQFARSGKRSQALQAAEAIADDEVKAKTIAAIARSLLQGRSQPR